MQALTINQLYAHLANLKEKGFGDKKIMISQDDEGNGYHELFFGITTAERIGGFRPWMLPCGVSVEDANANYVTLG